MRTPRFHLDAPLAPATVVALPQAAAAHAVRVLRLAPGDRVSLFNGDGHEYPAQLVEANSRTATVRIESRHPAERESPLRITLVQALARGEKMDWIVQKATELGVAAIVAVTTERSEVRIAGPRAAQRADHWRAVAIAACAQSGRAVVPEVGAPLPLDTWLSTHPHGDGGVRLTLHPGEGGTRVCALGPAPRSATLAIGPEGGFGERDLAALHAAGFRNLALGPRILRTETAGIAAIAALQAHWGDL